MVKKDYLQVAFFALVFALIVSLSISVAVSADELPEADHADSVPVDDDFNVLDVSSPDPVDYSGDFGLLNENLVGIQEQLNVLQETVADMSDTVSENDDEVIDYTNQFQLLSDKLDGFYDVLSVSENSISENSLFSTPLNEFTTDQQLDIFLIILFLVVFAMVIIAYFL